MPEPRGKLFPSATRPYSAMLDACVVITALMKRPKNNFQLTVGRWKFNFSFPEITKSEINQEILNFDTSKACQELGLLTKIIKVNSDSSTEIYTWSLIKA